MMLFDTLQADYITAFKARDVVRKDALNFVIAQLKNKKIELQKDLEDADVVSVLKKEVKSRQEAITYLVQAGNTEEQAREEGIVAVLESYLPQMISYDALTSIVKKIIVDTGITDLQKGRGEIVKAVMAEHKAVVDGKMLQDVINNMI